MTHEELVRRVADAMAAGRVPNPNPSDTLLMMYARIAVEEMEHALHEFLRKRHDDRS